MIHKRWWNHLRNALHEALAAEDEHHRIAKGMAIGVFLGFTPLFGLKTLLAIVLAFVFRASRIAAVVGVTLHDVILPFMPVVFRVEYQLGYWMMNNPHEWPPHLSRQMLSVHEWMSWTTFVTVGVPLLVGSMAISAPSAALTYWLTRVALHRRAQAKLKLGTP